MEQFTLLFRDFFNKLMRSSLNNRGIVLLIDLFICTVGFMCSLWVQLSTSVLPLPTENRLILLAIYLGACAVSFYLLKSFRGLIRHSSFREIWRVFLSLLLSGAILYTVLLIIGVSKGPSFFFVSNTFLFCFFLILSVRFVIVFLFNRLKSTTFGKRKKTLIYGIGPHSLALANWVNRSSHSQLLIQGFITRDENAKKTRIQDLPVFVLDIDYLDWFLSKYEITTILFPGYQSVRNEQSFVETCIDMGLSILVSPPLEGVDASGMSRIQMKPIQLENLLEREEIHIDLERIADQSKEKTILVTGAAGAIGSEIVRQLAANTNPGLLLLFDMAETPLHNLQLEMQKNYPSVRFVPIIGDVRNLNRLENVFSMYRPTIVYHAAAYKHVTLLEENPCEALLVNTLGTRRVCDAAVEHGVECFVLISTDKAVNPGNVVGASKQLAEMYVRSKALKIENKATRLFIVRFGNVLGPSGSVTARFRKQIEEGGPVTVTHPDMYRYFMTIQEAACLLLEAASFGKNGQTYLFDMGKPLRISKLASSMIELAGYTPNKDIQIIYTGLKAGEKLQEQPYSELSNVLTTEHEHILVDNSPTCRFEEVSAVIDELVDLSEKVAIKETICTLKSFLPDFRSNYSPNQQFDNP